MSNFKMIVYVSDVFKCPGAYRCHGQRYCTALSQVCDGIKDCPAGDDELFCSK